MFLIQVDVWYVDTLACISIQCIYRLPILGAWLTGLCVVKVFESIGLIDCILFPFENIVPFMRWRVASFITIDYRWTASIKPRLLFPHAGYATRGHTFTTLPLTQIQTEHATLFSLQYFEYFYTCLLTPHIIIPHMVYLLYILLWIILLRQRAIILTASYQCHHHVCNSALWCCTCMYSQHDQCRWTHCSHFLVSRGQYEIN